MSWDAHKKCSVKMASDEDRLTEIVRECVQNEMALQRSGSGSNVSLLSRTRNPTSNAARSASREAAASPVQASFEAEVPTREAPWVIRCACRPPSSLKRTGSFVEWKFGISGNLQKVEWIFFR